VQFIDLKIRVPQNRMGEFLAKMPGWGRMVGYALLEPAPETNGHVAPRKKKWKAKPDPNYKPTPNSSAALVLAAVTKQPRGLTELIKGLASKYPKSAVTSATYMLRDRALIRKDVNNKYETVND
jgi:hypothetical protein